MGLAELLLYFQLLGRHWRKNGSSRLAVLINLFLLSLAWIVLPLERESWGTLRAKFADYCPQVNLDAPKALDGLRIVIQFLFLGACSLPSSPFYFIRCCKKAITAVANAFHRLGELINEYGGKLLQGSVGNFDELDRQGARLPESVKIGLAWVLGILAAGLAFLCITQPFNIQGQVIFLSVMLVLALLLRNIKARITLMLLFVISIVVSGRYLWWRCTDTLNTGSALGIILSALLLGAELYAFVVMVLGYFQVCWVLDRKPYPMPDDKALWPDVDIFIPTYNESLDVIKPTVYAAQNMNWPADKLHVYVLDDGSRDVIENFAREIGVGYIKRIEHNHAKAGNINHAMTVTDSPFITIFDCDHVPSADFLEKTVGWLIKDDNIALVQTPHHFYSPDPFEKNLHLDRTLPIENALFHDFIQKGNDTWNATMFCGSSAVMRREALEEVGGIAVETVTEDAHTSLKLNRRGWSSAFIDVPLASGLSTETLAAHVGQRIRWARGMIQIFRLDNPFIGKGLTLPQRLCFFNAMFHFLHGLPRLIFLVAPLPYMFADIYIIYATAAAIFAYVLPHMIHSALTNQILQRSHRYPFLSGVYETVLAWYILIPTTVALFMPHVGKFNVTAKGGTIGEKYLDWSISKPFLILLVLNTIGLGIGIYKAIFDPNPEYLTLAINLGWIAYNMMILGASMAVAVEDVQTHQFPRVHCAIDAEVLFNGQVHPITMSEYSQKEVRLVSKEHFTAGLSFEDKIQLKMHYEGNDYIFNARLLDRSADNEFELEMLLASRDQERDFNRCTFARRGMWVPPEVKIDDRMWVGFLKLGQLACYGFKSMIEFLPGKLQYITQFLRWLATFAPRKPQSMG